MPVLCAHAPRGPGTGRSLGECHFAPGGDGVEPHPNSSKKLQVPEWEGEGCAVRREGHGAFRSRELEKRGEEGGPERAGG